MRRDDQRQAVKSIPLEQLKPFKNHPFQVRDDEEFRRLVESIEIHGVIHPAVARQIGEDCYELISGHRRKAACEVLGYSEMPVLVRSMTDDEAVVNMVDANLQRETILPSERAFAYKMKLVAMSHQGRKGFTSAQLGAVDKRFTRGENHGKISAYGGGKMQLKFHMVTIEDL
ncbi:ParB N-terminal domain-containing protein, partial [Pseudoflavonifractor phocaeensis]|uniref:ParB/RepB/Spo0J family partition protein n=1 Tax=Pseudoflavonifractor phocaeensis TaxID=1870988 RepID=UPI0019586E4C